MILFRRRRKVDPLLSEFTAVMAPLLEQALYDAGLAEVETESENGVVEALGVKTEEYSDEKLLDAVASAVEEALARLGWKPVKPVREALRRLPALKPSTLAKPLEGLGLGVAGRVGERLDRLIPEAAGGLVETTTPTGNRVAILVEIIEVLGRAGARVTARKL